MRKPKLPALKKPNLKSKKTIMASLLLAVVLAAIGWTIFDKKINDDRKVYAEAAGHKIYEDELLDLKGGDQSISDQDATTVLADKYFVEALAREEGITVSEEEVQAEYPGVEKQSTSKYIYQNIINRLYFNKLEANQRGIYKGKFITAHFSRHIPYKSALLAENKAADPLLGDAVAIAKDKKYAEDLINRLHSEIESGKITFEEAINIEKTDPVLGEQVYPTLTHSGSFDTSITPFTGVDINSIENNGEHLKAGQTSKPAVIRVSDSEEGNSTAESYFVMVHLDNASGGNAKTSFRKFIEQSKERLGYKIYV